MNEAAYRQAERRLWEAVGLEPKEHRVGINGASVRVQEVGSGEPVLFIHGGPNAGSTWAGMLPYFEGYRALLVDRPGTGLSDTYRIGDIEDFRSFARGFVNRVLSEMGVDRAHVVASSVGGYIALQSAAEHPESVYRMVQMACPAFVPGMGMPPFMRMMSLSLVRRIMDILPPNEKVGRSMLRQIGHGASLDAGVIPQVFFDWYLALQKHTDTMRNDGELIGMGGSFSGWDPTMTMSDDFLASVQTPTLFIWGEDDAFGGSDVAEHVVSIMPEAHLQMVPNSGHLPWLDIPEAAARATAEFLSGG